MLILKTMVKNKGVFIDQLKQKYKQTKTGGDI